MKRRKKGEPLPIGKTPKKPKTFIHIYLPADLRTRFDVVRSEMIRRSVGTRVALTEVTRRALELGVEILERELGIEGSS